MNDKDSRSHVEVYIKRTISFTVYLTFYLRLELIQKVSSTKESGTLIFFGFLKMSTRHDKFEKETLIRDIQKNC